MTDAQAGLIGRLNGRVSLWLARCAAAVLALLAVLTFFDVVGRYGFNKPFSFTVEMTELGMGLIVYFGVGLVTHERGHVSVDFVTIRLPARLRAAIDVLVQLIALGYIATVVWRLFLRAAELLEKGDYTPILYIPLWPIAFLMAFGSALLFTGLVVQMLSSIGDLLSPRARP